MFEPRFGAQRRDEKDDLEVEADHVEGQVEVVPGGQLLHDALDRAVLDADRPGNRALKQEVAQAALGLVYD